VLFEEGVGRRKFSGRGTVSSKGTEGRKHQGARGRSDLKDVFVIKKTDLMG